MKTDRVCNFLTNSHSLSSKSFSKIFIVFCWSGWNAADFQASVSFQDTAEVHIKYTLQSEGLIVSVGLSGSGHEPAFSRPIS